MNLLDLILPGRNAPSIPERPLPHFLVIGVQKGGTSWLWDQLRQHPGIWMPPFKELQFFNSEFIPSHRSWTVKHCDRAIEKLVEKKKEIRQSGRKQVWDTYLTAISRDPKPSLEWYQDCFRFPVPPKTLLGDVSPAYCTIPEEGVAYAKELLPDAKIVMIIRNPHKRIISQLRMKMSSAKRDLGKFHAGQWHAYVDDLNLYQRAIYSEYIPRWDRFFGDRILYLPFDLIRQDPAAFLHKVTNHLGVKSFTPKAADKPVHVTEKHPVPAPVEKLLAERVEPQWAYLQERFPADFTALCKY